MDQRYTSEIRDIAAVDRAFIRRGVEAADLDAVRVTLYHLTGDRDLEALPVAAKSTPEQKELVVARAVDWLEKHAGPRRVEEPSTPELRKRMDMAIGGQMGDLEFDSRRDLPGFRDFPWMVDWPNGRPALPEGFRVAIIGCGFSGVAMAIQLGLLGIPYVVLEKRADPGGTWSVNRYPDIRVDTISISYEFNFEKDHRWSEYFGRGPEVRGYLTSLLEKYDVRRHVEYQHELTRAAFDETRNSWTLEVTTPAGDETLEAAVLVSATGLFANPKIVDFEGLESFKGQVIHPSRWDRDFVAEGKSVAVIGNGSTGVQLLSAIAAEADNVHVFQRTPQWINPRAGYGKPVEPEVNWLLDNFPGYWNWWHFTAAAPLFEMHDLLLPDDEWTAAGGRINRLQDQLRERLTEYIKTETDGRQDLMDRLVPDYAPYARRAVVDNNWYRSLTRNNVELVTDDIVRFTEDGIETADGKVRKIDVAITATGFEVGRFLEPAVFEGRGGLDLREFWSKDGARAYISMMVPHFPNMFIMYGPNSQLLSGGTGLHGWFSTWAAYIAQCVMRVIEHGHSSIEVKPAAYDRYNAELDQAADGLILMRDGAAREKNYYINQHGRLLVNAPWYGPDFWRMCTHIQWNDMTLS